MVAGFAGNRKPQPRKEELYREVAGMKVVGVTTTHPGGRLDRVFREVARMDELTVEEVASWDGTPA